MNAPVPAIDLDAAADGMPSRHKAVANAIRHYRDAHSAHTDLTTAYDMLLSVSDMAKAADGSNAAARIAVPALIYTAVLLYVRATKTSSKHRTALNITNQFSVAEAAIHAELTELRDDALAHYGPGGAGHVWNEERVLLPLDRADDARIVVASKRSAYTPGFVRRVTPQVHRGMILFQKEMLRREEKLQSHLDAAFESDPDFPIILKSFLIEDARDVFGDHPAANIFDGDRQGLRSEVIWAEEQ